VILPDLSAWLVTQSVGVANVTLFEDFMPPEPNSCVVLTEYGGRSDPNVRTFGQAEITREFSRVQALVRGEPDDYVTPRLKAQDVVRAMSRLMTVTLSGIVYYTSTPLQAPFPLDRDQLRRYVFAVNFEFFKQVSTS
jgi:hypothetical protein